MEKLQPEGGHEQITAGSELYKKALASTAVVAIEIESMIGKFKFGQNLTEKMREKVIQDLKSRGAADDRQTVDRIIAWSGHAMTVRVPDTLAAPEGSRALPPQER